MSDMGAYDMLKLEHQLCFPLYAAARKVTALYQPHLSKLGITYTQYIVFMLLWEENSLSVGEICRRLYLDSGTLTPLLKKLEKEGYIYRQRSENDERVVMVSLTEKGMLLREKAKDIPVAVGGCVPLTEDNAVMLYQLLYQILGGIAT